MKKTEAYNLNVIETSDAFSPDPLNENTALLEQALSSANAGTAAEAKPRAAAVSAVEKRVAALEAHKFAVGTYTGTGTKTGDSQTIKLGISPAAVFVSNARYALASVRGALALTGNPDTGILEIVSGGFKAYGYRDTGANPPPSANENGQVYRYIAFC